jgi:hypothetical protein
MEYTPVELNATQLGITGKSSWLKDLIDRIFQEKASEKAFFLQVVHTYLEILEDSLA